MPFVAAVEVLLMIHILCLAKPESSWIILRERSVSDGFGVVDSQNALNKFSFWTFSVMRQSAPLAAYGMVLWFCYAT